ncbi:glucose-1-phosphate adenylyltransferase, partial [Shewanella sp. A25]|nr:glucose-1-phosphate adenylyltransferase [Shewanella shenzhenensis]
NIDIIRHELPRYVMVLSGDHVYRMDYAGLLAAHAESGADMTCCCMEVPIEEAANSFGVMEVDQNNRILGFQEKPAHPKPVP